MAILFCSKIKFISAWSFFLFMSIAQASAPSTLPRYQIKDGLAIYIGLLPAEMVEGHKSGSMHGGLPTGQHRYHIAIALFDSQKGERVNNATVLVRVNNRIGVGPDAFKKLEGMEMNGKFMYGNYFSLKTAGPYRIDIKIIPDKAHKPIEVYFEYDIAHT